MAALNDLLAVYTPTRDVTANKIQLMNDLGGDQDTVYANLLAATGLTRATASFNDALHAYLEAHQPLGMFDWKAAFYAGDPLWTPPADGDPVAAWKNGGTTRTEGAYLSTGAGLTLPGTTGNYASVPDEAALDITGDIDIRVKVALDDWTPAARSTFLSKWTAGGGYEFGVEAGGAIRFLWDDSLSVAKTEEVAAPGFTDGATKWVRVTLDVDNGASDAVARFYQSDDGESWSQIGSDQAVGATTDIGTNTSDVYVGSRGASTNNIAGDVHEVQVYDGIAGSKVLDVDFQRADTNKFTATTGQTVTVHNSLDAVQATGSKQPAYRASVAALNNRPAVQGDGVDDFLQTAAWSSALAQPTSIVVIGSISAASKNLVEGIAITNRSTIQRTPAGLWAIYAGSSVSGSAGDADPHLFAGVFDATDTLDIDGTEDISGNAGAETLTGLTISANYPGTGAFNGGHVAFVGAIAGDITADANWPAFVAWVESEYGIAVA